MTCQRCQGFMVVEFLQEPLEEWFGQDVTVWRCVICGDIVDPVVLANRVSPPNIPLAPGIRRRRRPTACGSRRRSLTTNISD